MERWHFLLLRWLHHLTDTCQRYHRKGQPEDTVASYHVGLVCGDYLNACMQLTMEFHALSLLSWCYGRPFRACGISHDIILVYQTRISTEDG